MSNRLRNSCRMATLIGLLFTVPFTGFGQLDRKQEAKVARLSPDLLMIQLEASRQSSSQQSSQLRQAAPATKYANSDENPKNYPSLAAVLTDPDPVSGLGNLC